MNITPAVLSAIFLSFSKLFQDAYQRAAKWADQVATTVPSNTKEMRYAWEKLIPRLRKWVGERVVHNVTARGYAIVNDKYELTVAVSREDIEDDNIGVYSVTIAGMGDQAALWPEDLVKTALQAGATNLCFDGQAYFSASHPVDMDDSTLGTYQNYWSTGMALTPTNYNTVRAAMMSYKGENGRPLGVVPNLLVVPPQLEAAARQILNADFIAPAAAIGGNAANVVQNNVLKGSADLLVNPYLADEPTVWYLMDTRKAVKPIIFQLRDAPALVMLVDPQSENVFFRDEYVYGVRARGAAGYSLPFLAARAIA